MSVVQNKNIQFDILSSLEGFLSDAIIRLSDSFEILYVNNVLLGMLGFTSMKEIRKLTIGDVLCSSDATIDLKEKLLKMKLLMPTRVLLRRKDGSSFWCVLVARKVQAGGGIFYDGCLRDISELVHLENHLNRFSMELDKQKSETNRFLYSVSHDIRAPIATILSLIGAMREDYPAEGVNSYLSMLNISAKKADHFIHDVVNYTQHRIKLLADGRVDFKLVIESVLENLKQECPNAANMSFEISLDDEYVFYSDLEVTTAVLKNLIKNAIDFADAKKSVSLVSIQTRTLPEKVFIEVFDNGIGISESTLPLVFDMFYRGSILSSGSGIGLYAARELAGKLGGTISIQSQLKVGTIVTVVIPNSRKGKLINRKREIKASFLGPAA